MVRIWKRWCSLTYKGTKWEKNKEPPRNTCCLKKMCIPMWLILKIVTGSLRSGVSYAMFFFVPAVFSHTIQCVCSEPLKLKTPTQNSLSGAKSARFSFILLVFSTTIQCLTGLALISIWVKIVICILPLTKRPMNGVRVLSKADSLNLVALFSHNNMWLLWVIGCTLGFVVTRYTRSS